MGATVLHSSKCLVLQMGLAKGLMTEDGGPPFGPDRNLTLSNGPQATGLSTGYWDDLHALASAVYVEDYNFDVPEGMDLMVHRHNRNPDRLDALQDSWR